MAEEVKKGPEIKNLVLSALFFILSVAGSLYIGWNTQLGLLFDVLALASLIILLASISALIESKKKVLKSKQVNFFTTRYTQEK